MKATLPNGQPAVSFWLRRVREVGGVIFIVVWFGNDFFPMSPSARLYLLIGVILMEIVNEVVLRFFQTKEFGGFLREHVSQHSEPDVYELNDALAVIGSSSKMTRRARMLVKRFTLHQISDEEFRDGMFQLAGLPSTPVQV